MHFDPTTSTSDAPRPTEPSPPPDTWTDDPHQAETWDGENGDRYEPDPEPEAAL